MNTNKVFLGTVFVLALAPLAAMAGPGMLQDTLQQGAKETLAVGEEVKSANGQYTLKLQEDGNLVLTDSQGKAVWESGTAGRGATEAVMQADGNLVLKTRLGRTIWRSATDGYANARLMVQDDGNLVIYNERGLAVWAKGKFKDSLDPGEKLMAGEFLKSQNGQYTLRMQDDGNLVVYDSRRRAAWESGTGRSGAVEVIMQGDGNLVLRDKAGKVVWASDTDGFANATLKVNDEGQVMLAKDEGSPIWTNGQLNPEAKPDVPPAGVTVRNGRGNDARSGRDAGSSMADAIAIRTADSPIAGELSEADPVDMYAVELETSWHLILKMVSMSTQDYNVALLDSNGGVLVESARGMGQSESIEFTATAAGTHYVRISRNAGDGRYEFEFSIHK